MSIVPPFPLIYAVWVCVSSSNPGWGTWDVFIFSNKKCVSSTRTAPPRHADMSVMNGNEPGC